MVSKIVIALDTDINKAKDIIDKATIYGFDIFKIGHLLFDTHPEIIYYINKKNANVLLDLKFHDIPSVIVKAIKGICGKYKIWGMTVHALGGKNFLKEVKSVDLENNSKPIFFAVTILTSLEENDLKVMGFKTNIKNTITNLAKLAKNCGIDGAVCSPKEIKLVKQTCGEKFLTLVPGVSILSKNTDQKRTDTIEKAIQNGADYIVVGRSIYEGKDIKEKLEYIKKLII